MARPCYCTIVQSQLQLQWYSRRVAPIARSVVHTTSLSFNLGPCRTLPPPPHTHTHTLKQAPGSTTLVAVMYRLACEVTVAPTHHGCNPFG